METLITQKEAAQYIGISTASISNWIRHGYLTSYSNQFSKEEIVKLKTRIDTGEINRLNFRANKSKSKNQFIPNEYISSGDYLSKIQEIVAFISDNKVNIDQALFLLAINLFRDTGDIVCDDIDEIFEFNDLDYRRSGVFKHIRKWLNIISSGNTKYNNEKVKYILDFNLPKEKENDVLGIIYQSIIHEGQKSDFGSYYTPIDIVKSLVNDNIAFDSTVLDPCCGTGQFLLNFAKKITDPKNIYGFDIDERAINIAATNLLLFYNEIDFIPNVFHKNSLLIGKADNLFEETSEYNEQFDFIATNPPWGAKYDKKALSQIKNNFNEIQSKESFSFFICQAYRFLKKNGTMSFVLPESITNVKTHNDIRSFILSHLSIQQINIMGNCFKNVFSSVVTIQMKKNTADYSEIKVLHNDNEYFITQNRFNANKHFLFDIYINSDDIDIIHKMTNREILTLENNSDWALGIVTGDNKKFIKLEKNKKEMEPIFKGSDVDLFCLKQESNYIHFLPEYFQQVALTNKYRAPEKLIYKFISSKLVFAYDDKQSLTLNSANILIPRIDNYPIKVILAFLNSELFNFYYKKRFNSIKILRGDLEQLPFPILTDIQKKDIINLVDSILEKNTSIQKLNDFIYSYYGITDTEKKYVFSYIKGKKR